MSPASPALPGAKIVRTAFGDQNAVEKMLKSFELIGVDPFAPPLGMQPLDDRLLLPNRFSRQRRIDAAEFHQHGGQGAPAAVLDFLVAGNGTGSSPSFPRTSKTRGNRDIAWQTASTVCFAGTRYWFVVRVNQHQPRTLANRRGFPAIDMISILSVRPGPSCEHRKS